MGGYSIKDLEVLSGIKAHTLRIWEQRYGIMNPSRTNTNIRKYTSEDLKLILNISLLNQKGYKISKIAEMTAEQLNREVLNLTDHNHTYSDQIYALTLAMIDIDEVRFEKVMARNIMQFGLEKTMINIVYPFLVKMGLMWQTGSITPAQEHFMSNLIRQKLIVAIDGQYGVPKEGSKKFMLYLGEGELHELSLLFTHYLVKSRHHKSIYLGQWLPYQDLEDMYKTHRPDYLVTVLTSQPFNMEVDTYITKLATSFPDVNIVLSGYQTIGLSMKLPANVRIIKNIESFITFLDEEL